MANCLYRGESYVRRPCLSRRTNSVAKANRRRMWCSVTLLTSYKSLLQTKIVRFLWLLINTVQLQYIRLKCMFVSHMQADTIIACCVTSGYLLTYSMEQKPSWEANWFSASQEISRILWNPKVHYRIHKCPPPVPIVLHLVRYINLTFGLVKNWTTHHCQAVDTNKCATEVFFDSTACLVYTTSTVTRVQHNISTSDRACSCCSYQTGIQHGLMKNNHNYLIKNGRLNLNGGQNYWRQPEQQIFEVLKAVLLMIHLLKYSFILLGKCSQNSERL